MQQLTVTEAYSGHSAEVSAVFPLQDEIKEAPLVPYEEDWV